MSKLIYSNLILVAALSVGCSKGGDSPAPSATPTQLNTDTYQKMKQVVPLSDSSKAQMAEFGKTNRSKFPSTSLFFDATGSSDDAAKRSKATASLDTDGSATLAKIKANCTIDPGSDSNSGIPKAGSTLTTSRIKKVSGTACPISYNENLLWSFVISARDQNTGVMSGKMTGNNSSNLVLADQALQDSTKWQGYAFSIDMSGILEGFSSGSSADVKTGIEYVKGNVTGSLNAMNAKLPISGSVEAIMRPGEKDFQFYLKIALPDGPFILGVVFKNKKKEIFVNGQPYTEDQLKNEFGIDDLDM